MAKNGFIFDFRPGRNVKGVNAQALGEWLEDLRTEKGSLTPAIVVEAAKADPECPGHAAFEWDKDAAAEQHWLNQARRLITSIRVLNTPMARPVTAFVTVKTPDHGRQYMPTIEAMSDDELRVRVLVEIRQALESIERRYAHFSEIGKLLENLRKQVG